MRGHYFRANTMLQTLQTQGAFSFPYGFKKQNIISSFSFLGGKFSWTVWGVIVAHAILHTFIRAN